MKWLCKIVSISEILDIFTRRTNKYRFIVYRITVLGVITVLRDSSQELFDDRHNTNRLRTCEKGNPRIHNGQFVRLASASRDKQRRIYTRRDRNWVKMRKRTNFTAM